MGRAINKTVMIVELIKVMLPIIVAFPTLLNVSPYFLLVSVSNGDKFGETSIWFRFSSFKSTRSYCCCWGGSGKWKEQGVHQCEGNCLNSTFCDVTIYSGNCLNSTFCYYYWNLVGWMFMFNGHCSNSYRVSGLWDFDKGCWDGILGLLLIWSMPCYIEYVFHCFHFRICCYLEYVVHWF